MWLIDVETVGQADALIRNLHVKMAFDFSGVDLDNPAAFGVSVFDRVRNEFVYQESQRDCVVRRKEHWVGVVTQSMTVRRSFQFFAKLTHEVHKFDKANVRTAPQMIMDLGYSVHAQAGIFKRVLDILGYCTTSLHAQ